MLFVRAVMIVLLGAGLGGIWSRYFRPGHNSQSQSQATICESDAAWSPILLAPAEAAQKCDTRRVLWADVRSADAFAEGHIASAIHLPCQTPLSQGSMDSVAEHAEVLVYGTTTEEAIAVAQSLHQRFPQLKLFVLKDGFAAWQSSGNACESGSCDHCDDHAHP